MTADTRRAIGIDPGTARLGYAVVESRGGTLTLVEAGCITTLSSMAMERRLQRIYEESSAIIHRLSPNEMAIEELFFAKNVTTAVAVGQARGIALLVAAQRGLSLYEYKPMQVKQAVHGYGLATKAQVGEMVRVLLRLEAIPQPDDAADAAAIAICHLNTLRVPTAEPTARRLG
ncbi:MAG TPA: crossover junction endodeoxyribonuclease RuvC [Ktedonobacterales bacterium]